MLPRQAAWMQRSRPAPRVQERNYQANDIQIADGQLTVFAGYEWRLLVRMLQGPSVLSGYGLSACVIHGSLTVGLGVGGGLTARCIASPL